MVGRQTIRSDLIKERKRGRGLARGVQVAMGRWTRPDGGLIGGELSGLRH